MYSMGCVQAESFQRLNEDGSGDYDVCIRVGIASAPFAGWRIERRSESLVVLTEIVRIELPFLDKGLE